MNPDQPTPTAIVTEAIASFEQRAAIDAQCTHGADCPVHADSGGLHNFDDTRVHADVVFTLTDLLQIISDDMSDESAYEREFPDHIPACRWQVVDWRGREHSHWTAALALSRALLGQPDPNQPTETS